MKRLILHASLRDTHPNISKVTLMQMAENVQFVTPVLAIFIMRKGLPIDSFFLLMSLYNWSWLILEIPSGYLSDWWGRKPTLVLGSICTLLGYFALALGSDFWHFALAFLLLAGGSSFESGTFESIVHESLQKQRHEERSREVLRRIFSVSFTVQALGAVVGGILATQSLIIPVLATFPFLLVHLLLALSLEETNCTSEHREALRIGTLRNIMQETIGTRGPLRAIILIYGVISTITLCLFWVTQPYQEQALLPLSLFGFSHALMQYANAWVSRRMISLEKRLRDDTIILGISIVVILSCILASIHVSLAFLPFLLISRSMFGAIHPFATDIINKLTSPDRRATVHSMKQFWSKLLFAIVSPAFGWFVARSISGSLAILGIAGGVTLSLALWYWHTVRRSPTLGH